MEVHIHNHRVPAHLPCHANAKFCILTLTDVKDPLLPQACGLNNLSQAHKKQRQILSTTWLNQSSAWSLLVGTQKYFMVEFLFHFKKSCHVVLCYSSFLLFFFCSSILLFFLLSTATVFFFSPDFSSAVYPVFK